MRNPRARARKVTLTVSASEAHSMSNIRMTCAEAIESARRIVKFRDGLPEGERPTIEVGVSTAFGCTIQGDVPEDFAIEIAVKCAQAGADTVGHSDSVGYANPAQVKRMFTRLKRELGDKAGGAHLHNTRGQGLANVVAALDAGVTTFDASQGGIGGCPYAPGATGNIVTEDLVFLLESMGLDTGIDMEKLLEARKFLSEGLPGEPVYGFVPDAGLPKNFRRAAEAASS
jgi:hydroxymethylglutaryl-CoA lyase